MSLTGKPELTTATRFSNDGFWPDLSLAELMDKYRIPSEYANDTISWGLTLALVNVNLELEPVKAAIIATGFNSLAAYTSANSHLINNQEQREIQYKHAVYAYAKAQLIPQFNSMNRRENAVNAAKESPETEQYWLDQSAHAVQQLFGKFVPDQLKPSVPATRATLI